MDKTWAKVHSKRSRIVDEFSCINHLEKKTRKTRTPMCMRCAQGIQKKSRRKSKVKQTNKQT